MADTTSGRPAPVERLNMEERELYGPVREGPPNADTEHYEIHLRPALRARQDEVRDVQGLDTAALQVRHRKHVAIARDAGLSPLAYQRIYDTATDLELAEQRGTLVDLETDIQQNNETVRHTLRNRYGAERAEQMLTAANAFVAQHPTLQALLRTRGLGSQPAVVETIVEHVRRQHPGGL